MDISMGRESKYFRMGTRIRDYMQTANLKAMEFISGKMGQHTKDSSKMVYDMGMANGYLEMKNMRVST